MNFAWRIYQRLARAFPHEFKVAYGQEVVQLGEDVVHDIARREGAAGLFRLIADIAIRVPLEYLSEMRRDMRYASRALIKSPGFALVGIISMGLGIGLTTNVYSTRWALLTRELPAAANAKKLVIAEKPVSYYYIERYRDQKNLFAGVAALQNGVPFNVNLQGLMDSKPERVFGQLVSPDYFSVLGVEPQRGRLLSAELDKPGDAPVVVISDRFWRNRLNSSPNAVGQTLRLNGQTATIVGITPRNFDGALAMNPSELFVPITVPASLAPELANDVLHQRNAREFVALMCLAPGITIDSAEAGLDVITRHLDKDEGDPSAPSQADKAKRVVLLPAGTRAPVPRNLRHVVVAFFVVLMGLTMTIACMNLVTMLLARGANRSKEFAIRLSVGASRFRLVRQMVSEGILLSLLGGVAGFALAYGLYVLNSQLPQSAGASAAPDVALDWHAAVFTLALSVICGIGFSLAPALQATRSDVAPALKTGAALELPGHRRFGLRNLAVLAQVTGSLMLLLITGFLVIGLTKANSVEARFDPRTMVLASIDPVRDGYTPEEAQALFEKLPERLKASGTVCGIALAAQPPFSSDDEAEDIQLTAEDPLESSRVQKSVVRETVGAGYFAALNEPKLAGREFEELDQRSSPADELKPVALPAILNERAARGIFGNGDAIGKHVRADSQSYEVVGVVRDLKDGSGVSRPIVYAPLTQRDFARPPAGGITIIVRSDAGTDALSSVRSAIASIDPNLYLFDVQTLSEYLERTRYATRSALRTYGGIGVFGLVLSAIGLAGVTAYAVARRRKEIGIRMAIGAQPGRIVRLVTSEVFFMVLAGAVAGLGIGLASVRYIETLLYDVKATDAGMMVLPVVAISVGAMLAAVPAVVRAVRIDPVSMLRSE